MSPSERGACYWIIDPEMEVASSFVWRHGGYPEAPAQLRAGDVLTNPLFPDLPIAISGPFR